MTGFPRSLLLQAIDRHPATKKAQRRILRQRREEARIVPIVFVPDDEKEVRIKRR